MLLCDVMEHALERAGWGHEAPGTPQNAAEAQPEEATWEFQSCQGGDHVNQRFSLAGQLKNGREGSVPAKVDLG